MITEKSENNRNSSGCDVSRSSISAWLNAPLRPRNGIQAMVRMIAEVRNGTQQEQNHADRVAAHVENEEVGDIETEKQRDRPDDQREFQGAAIEPQRCGARRQLPIIV